jgi:hypothetical protein
LYDAFKSTASVSANALECVRKLYPAADKVHVEGPEYAAIPKLPGGHNARLSKDRPVACGILIRFRWRDGSRTTHDDWVVWVTSDHKAVDWSGNEGGDKWRPNVRSFAKK